MRNKNSFGAFRTFLAGILVAAVGLVQVPQLGAQQQTTPQGSAAGVTPGATPSQPLVPPADYIIGPEDVLTINFRYEEDLSGDVTVRPDGKISLPIVQDVQASGLTIEQLRAKLTDLSSAYFQGDPAITVQATEIHSRKVFISGNVARVGVYPLLGPTDVLQLIAMAGGLLEWAKQKDVLILRTEGDRRVSYKFNYNDVKKGKNLQQNIMLKPGDTIVVP